MNIYQKNYSEQFIKELPIDFHKIKQMDLTTIPVEYHSLFTTDWNWGRYSTMPAKRKTILHQLFLEYQHNDVQASILMNKTNTQAEVLEGGFSKEIDENKLQGFVY